MRVPLVAGNWKLNGSMSANRELLDQVIDGLPAAGVDVMVCPPYVYLVPAAQRLDGTGVLLGAQNVSAKDKGAFTGEVSAAMLRDVGCTHVIVGHSERRTLFGEADEIVAAKFAAARAGSVVPVLCVGETLAEREAGETVPVVRRQLDVVLEHVGTAGFDGAIVAYEPVWAIGTGRTASPEQAQAVHAEIRARLARADANIGAQTRILYGGSVKGANAADLFSMQDIDGGLIGGASLDAGEFLAICRAAAGTDS
jgi:triosephosphate isomerase